MNNSYIKIAEHYNNTFKEHGDTHKGMDWPNDKDVLTRFEAMEGIRLPNTSPKFKLPTLLDFGCGTGHFYEYLDRTLTYYDYSGLDINEDMINLAGKKHPQIDWYHLDILKDDVGYENLPNFDYIVCNGTFTIKKDLTYKEMHRFFEDTITKLWKKTNKGIAFNLMSTIVDWEREDLFHVNLDLIGSFCKDFLSRNFTIKHGYGNLYEYTVYCYK